MTDEPCLPTFPVDAAPPTLAQAHGPALPRFPLGQLVATPGAVQTLEEFGVAPLTLIKRHVSGDWGDLCRADKQENELALTQGFRIMSSYALSRQAETGSHVATLWIITEADRSSTCILLPSEY